MKLKIAYLLIIGTALVAFVLQAEWLLYVAFAALLLTALANFRGSGVSGPLPQGMVAPHQAQSPGARAVGAHTAFGGHAFGPAPMLPKKKKKIRRPIIIIQPPPHAESLTHGILEESVKHSFPHFMTPQAKRLHTEEKAEKEELMHLLKEQRKELKELREELEESPGFRRRRRDDED